MARSSWMAGARLGTVCLGFALLPASAPAGQQREPILLQDWTQEGRGSFSGSPAGLRVEGSGGAAHSKPVLVDFELSLEFRLLDRDAEASVLLRSGIPKRGAPSNRGYRVLASRDKDRLTVSIEGLSGKVRRDRGEAPRLAHAGTDDWARLRVRCNGDELTIWVNEQQVLKATGEEYLAGRVAIEARRGAVEYREVVATPLVYQPPPVEAQTPSEAPSARSGGVVLPQPTREVRPIYTVEALERKVEGTVWVEVIVRPDGAVGHANVTKSLDPDLDAMALAAARRWRFRPGQRNGVAVSVLVTIELTFKMN